LLVIPAIDLKGGRCVRLWQGIRNRETVYFEDPLQVAKIWIEKGARRLHIVDLNGAFMGAPQHLEIAEKIKKTFSVPLQYGGGIRTLRILEEVIGKGIDFAIIGTRALSKDFVQNAVQKFGGRIIVSVDCRKDKVALKGWQEEAPVNLQGFVKNLAKTGIKTVILTDITRDGTLKGVDIGFIKNFLKKISCNVIIAGGISSLEDIRRIKKLQDEKIKGVIIGKALYTGAIKLEEALMLVGEE